MMFEWNSFGVLPPIAPGSPGHDLDRSPYVVTMREFIDHFCFSEQREKILGGLVCLRKEIYNIGIRNGFQWIDGSFLEDIKTLEDREPNDIDVVTFFTLPDELDQTSLYNRNQAIFNHDSVKSLYLVDSYWMPMQKSVNFDFIRGVVYWNSLWSHRRNGQWKGYVQIPLDYNETNTFMDLLQNSTGGEK